MPQSAKVMQNTFSAGQISERMLGQVDYDRYQNSCVVLENMIAELQGGAFNRPGFGMIASAENSGVTPVLMGFEYSDIQAYMLEWGRNILRFFKNGGQIVSATTTASITNGTFGSDISGWDDRSTGGSSISHNASDERLSLNCSGVSGEAAWAEQDVDITGSTETQHILKFKICRKSIRHDPKIRLRVGDTTTGNSVVDDREFGVGLHCYAFDAPSTSPMYVQFRLVDVTGTVDLDNISLLDDEPVELETPYGESKIQDLKPRQSHDVMYIPDITGKSCPYKLMRYGHYSWSLAKLWFDWPPFRDQNVTDTKIEVSATATGKMIAVTATADLFESRHVGGYFRFPIMHENGPGFFLVTAITDTQHAQGHVMADMEFTDTTEMGEPRDDWAENAWSDHWGWPRSVSFSSGDRLVWGGNKSEPNRAWGSVVGDYENHDYGEANADDAWRHPLSSHRSNVIKHLFVDRRLLVLTNGSEWWMGGDEEAITPANCPRRRESGYGVTNTMPIDFDSGIVFVQRGGRIVRLWDYEYMKDKYVGQDIILLAEQFTRNHTIIGGAYQQNPGQVLWFVRNDGKLLSCTLMPEQKIISWALHETDGEIEGAAIIPGDEYDELWIAVKRIIGGVDRRYIERMAPYFKSSDPMDGRFLDSWLTWNGDAWDIIDIDNSNPARVSTSGVHTLSNGDDVYINGVEGMTEVNYGYFKVINSNPAGAEFDLDGVDATNYDAYTSGGTVWKCATTFTGLSHLEGKSVGIVADGGTRANKIVASGEIELDHPASQVVIGLGYTSNLAPVPPVFNTDAGTVLADERRITDVMIRFYQSFGCKIAPLDISYGTDYEPAADKLESVRFWTSGDFFAGKPPTFFTGDKKPQLRGAYGTSKTIYLRQDEPMPLHVLAIVYTIEI